MYVIPYEIMTVFIKTLKLTGVYNGINVNPCTRITKKGLRQQTTPVGDHRFTWLLQILFVKCVKFLQRESPDVVHLAQQ